MTGKLLGSNLGLVVCENKKSVAHLCIEVCGMHLHRSLWHAFGLKSVALVWCKVPEIYIQVLITLWIQSIQNLYVNLTCIMYLWKLYWNAAPIFLVLQV